MQLLDAKLKMFKSKSQFVCDNNRLDSTPVKGRLKFFTFSDPERKYIDKENLVELKPDELFRKGQSLAFGKKYDESRIVLRYLLNKTPNYHDARILLGRTFAWNGQYDTARTFFQEVLSRSPAYDDAFNASADIEFWIGNHEKSLLLIEEGLTFNPDNVDLLARRARALWIAGKTEQSRKIAEAVLARAPQHELALDILQKSKP
jgi:lipoteichoic acid synthase